MRCVVYFISLSLHLSFSAPNPPLTVHVIRCCIFLKSISIFRNLEKKWIHGLSSNKRPKTVPKSDACSWCMESLADKTHKSLTSASGTSSSSCYSSSYLSRSSVKRFQKFILPNKRASASSSSSPSQSKHESNPGGQPSTRPGLLSNQRLRNLSQKSINSLIQSATKVDCNSSLKPSCKLQTNAFGHSNSQSCLTFTNISGLSAVPDLGSYLNNIRPTESKPTDHSQSSHQTTFIRNRVSLSASLLGSQKRQEPSPPK